MSRSGRLKSDLQLVKWLELDAGDVPMMGVLFALPKEATMVSKSLWKEKESWSVSELEPETLDWGEIGSVLSDIL